MVTNAEDSIRVLIVDDIAETRENLRKLLQFESDVNVVGAARTGEEGIQQARDLLPDVILMDINMPDMDGITATQAIIKEVPFAQIVILSVQSDANYMRRAMQAGARDFIPKPPSGDELISTIRSVAVRAREQREKYTKPAPQAAVAGPGLRGATAFDRQGKLIAIYSSKGGVGCTTLLSNMAVGLHSDQTPTVLVDTSLQFGDVSVFLNMQIKTSIVDLAMHIEELDRELLDDVLMVHECGLRILAAPPRPELADEITAEHIRKILQSLKRTFPYVLVDTSSTMDDITLAVLDSADLLITVATPDIPAIKDARLLFDLLAVLDFPTSKVMFVLNKMDRRTGITAEAVAENLKCDVDGWIPAEERLVTTSINRGEPLLMGDTNRPPAKNILELLGMVEERISVNEQEEVDLDQLSPRRLIGR
ncbi:MAG TPA: MinD/ParA family protein [Anaerolineae bacterium]|nr:MinD/ParA family protein [Anaerolineae bacterium]